MEASKKRIIAVRFSDNEMTEIVRELKRRSIKNVSDFIRAATFEKARSEGLSHFAGKNKISYVPEKDTFKWSVELDEGGEFNVLDYLSLDFIQDLREQITFQLNKRNELLGKKKKSSVAIPRGLVK